MSCLSCACGRFVSLTLHVSRLPLYRLQVHLAGERAARGDRGHAQRGDQDPGTDPPGERDGHQAQEAARARDGRAGGTQGCTFFLNYFYYPLREVCVDSDFYFYFYFLDNV